MSRATLRDRFRKRDVSARHMGRPPILGADVEAAVYKYAEGQAYVGKSVGPTCLKKKLGLMAKKLGTPSERVPRPRYFRSFLRRVGLKTRMGHITDPARFFSATEDTVGRFGDVVEIAQDGVLPKITYVGDECGFAAEATDRRVRHSIVRARARARALTYPLPQVCAPRDYKDVTIKKWALGRYVSVLAFVSVRRDQEPPQQSALGARIGHGVHRGDGQEGGG